jgi:Ca-activated chloride channel family protein
MASKKLIILSLILLPISLFAETAADYANRGAQNYIFGNEDEAQKAVIEGLQKFPDDPELREMTFLFKKKDQQKDQQSQSQKGGQGADQKDKQNQSSQQNQSAQNQNQSEQKKDSKQNQKSQSLAKNEPPKNQQPQPGESPSPSSGDDEKKQDQQSGKEPNQTPSPSSGQNQSPSPSPGEGSQENTEPSPTPSAAPSRSAGGELKAASEDNSQKPAPNAVAIAGREPAKPNEMTPQEAEELLQSMKDEEARVQLDERRPRRNVYKDW